MKHVAIAISVVLCVSLIAPSSSSRPATQAGGIRALPTQLNLTDGRPDIVVPAGPIVGSGDFNGDGITDLLESRNDPIAGMTGGGIIFGGRNIGSPSETLSIARPDLIIAPGPPALSRPWFRDLRPAIDLNGDGANEIVADAEDAVAPDGRRVRATYIYFGSHSLQAGEIDLLNRTPDLKIFSRSFMAMPYLDFNGQGMGISNVKGAIADINGDGTNDLVSTGTLPSGGPSVIAVMLGPFVSGRVIDFETQAPDVVITGDLDGVEHIKVQDVNGDKISDILIPKSIGPRVDILMGSTEFRPGTEVSLDQGGASAVIEGFPRSYFSLTTGDINGDGIADIWLSLSMVLLDGGVIDLTFPGEVYVVFGSGSLPGRRVNIGDSQQDVTIRGAERVPGSSAVADRLGEHISPLDLNGDGLSDVLVSAAYGAGPKTRFEDSGAAYVVLGSKDLGSGTTLELGRDQQDVKMFIEEKPGRLNLYMGGAFDLNGDGYSDIGFHISRPIVPPPPFEAFYFDTLNIVFGGPVSPPEITKAKFQRGSSELVISGRNFNGAMRVEINGILLDGEPSFDPASGRLTIQGTKRQLNLNSGKNSLTVIRKGSRSNAVKVKT